MPRLSKDTIAEREDYMRQLFMADPSLTAEKANEMFAIRFKGSRMRPQRVYAIRREVLESASRPQPVFETAAARDRTAPALPGAVTLLEVTPGTEESGVKLIQAMKAKGVFAGEVDRPGHGYIVVRMS